MSLKKLYDMKLDITEDELRYLYQNLVVYADTGIRNLQKELKKDGFDSMHHNTMANKVWNILNHELLCNRSLYEKCGKLMMKKKINVWGS